MTVYEIISFRQKGITSGNSHYERHRFDKKKNAQAVLESSEHPKLFYTFTKLTIEQSKVVNSELISCR